MKINILISFFIALNINLNAQHLDNQIYTNVDVNPEYPQGQSALFHWLGKNIKVSQLKLSDVCYINTIRFVIEKNGKITQIEPILPCGIKTYDKSLNSIFEKMPRWYPGKQNGKIVRVRYTLSIRIRNE